MQIKSNTKIADGQIEFLTNEYNQAKATGNLALASQIAKARQAWLNIGEAITDHHHQKSLNDDIDFIVQDIKKSLTSPTSKWFKIAAGTFSIVGGVACFGSLGAACLPSQWDAASSAMKVLPNWGKSHQMLSGLGSSGQGVVQAGTGVSTLSGIPDSVEQGKQTVLNAAKDRNNSLRQEKSQNESSAMSRKEQMNQAQKEEENNRSRAFSDMARAG